jgi:ribitol-5-phosphate 2-dehydrogenase
VDHAFECVGGNGSPIAIEQIIDLIKPEGTISILGVSEYPVQVNTRMILERDCAFSAHQEAARLILKTPLRFMSSTPRL